MIELKSYLPVPIPILSYEEYERLKSLEDAYWIEKAKLAEEEGFIGVENSMEFINCS